jgi:hypothetical protein
MRLVRDAGNAGQRRRASRRVGALVEGARVVDCIRVVDHRYRGIGSPRTECIADTQEAQLRDLPREGPALKPVALSNGRCASQSQRAADAAVVDLALRSALED